MIVYRKKTPVYLFTNDIKQHYVQLKRQEDSPSLHVERRQWGAGAAGDATAAAPAAADATAARAAVAAAVRAAVAAAVRAAVAAAVRAAVAAAVRAAVAAAVRATVAAAVHAAVGRGRGRLRPRSVIGRHWSLLVDVASVGRGR